MLGSHRSLLESTSYPKKIRLGDPRHDPPGISVHGGIQIFQSLVAERVGLLVPTASSQVGPEGPAKFQRFRVPGGQKEGFLSIAQAFCQELREATALGR